MESLVVEGHGQHAIKKVLFGYVDIPNLGKEHVVVVWYPVFDPQDKHPYFGYGCLFHLMCGAILFV